MRHMGRTSGRRDTARTSARQAKQMAKHGPHKRKALDHDLHMREAAKGKSNPCA